MFQEKLLITALISFGHVNAQPTYWYQSYDPLSQGGSSQTIPSGTFSTPSNQFKTPTMWNTLSSYPQSQPWTQVTNNYDSLVVNNYQDTCLQTWTHLPPQGYDSTRLKLKREYDPSYPWHTQHNNPAISWQMFSDLYETNDQTWWDTTTSVWRSTKKKYIYDYYVDYLQAGSINSGANRWEVNKVTLEAEVKHWLIQTEKENRFSGLASQLNSRNSDQKFDINPVYHGYESSTQDLNSQITQSYKEINGSDMKINRIKKVTFDYAIESLNWLERFIGSGVAQTVASNGKTYILDQPFSGAKSKRGEVWWGKLSVSESQDGQEFQKVTYLDKIYHRVFQICFEGQRINESTGAVVESNLKECIGQSAQNYQYQTFFKSLNPSTPYSMELSQIGSTTYDLTRGQNNNQITDQYALMGFNSWFTQIDNEKGNLLDYGVAGQQTTNIVGWLGLVVLDHTCLRCKNLPTIPNFTLSSSGCQIVNINLSNLASGDLLVSYGTSLNEQNQKTSIRASQQTAQIQLSGQTNSQIYVTITSADCPTGCTCPTISQTLQITSCTLSCATIIQTVSEDNDSVTMRFSYSQSYNSVAADGFEIKRRIVNQFSQGQWEVIQRVQNSVTQFTATGLIAGTSYEFAVFPYSENLYAQNCNPYRVNFNPIVCPTDIQLNGQIQGCSGFQFNVYSSSSSQQKVQPFSSYQIQVSTGFSSNFVTLNNMNFVGNSATVSSINGQAVQAGTNYSFKVIGIATNCPQITSQPIQLNIPVQAAPKLDVVGQNCNSINLSWNGGSAGFWQLQYAVANTQFGQQQWQNVQMSMNQQNTYQFTGVPNLGNAYYFRLLNTQSSNCGPNESNTVQGAIQTQVTPSFTAVASCNSITFSYTLGSGSTTLEYQNNQYGWQTVDTWASRSSNLGNTFTLSSLNGSPLAQGVSYSFRLVSSGGACGATQSVSQQFTLIKPVIPTIRVVSSTCSAVTLQILQGSQYQLQYSIANSFGNVGWQNVDTWNSNRMIQDTFIVNGLQSGTSYQFRLSGSNQCGQVNQQSELIATKTQAVPTLSVQGTCTGFDVRWSGTGNLILQYRRQPQSWMEVQSWVNVEQWNWSQLSQGNQQSLTITSLNNQQIVAGVSYSFQILSTGECGTVPSQTQIASLITAAQPTLSAVASCDSIQFSWTGVQGNSLQYQTANSQWVDININQSNLINQLSTYTLNSLPGTTLQGGQTYNFRIQTQTACGIRYGTTSVTMLTKTVNTLSTPVASCSANGGVSVSFTYQGDQNAVLQYRTSLNNWQNVDNWNTGLRSQNQITLTSISNTVAFIGGQTYSFRLISSGQCSVQSQEVSVQIPSTTPPSISASLSGCNAVTLNWSLGQGGKTYQISTQSFNGLGGAQTIQTSNIQANSFGQYTTTLSTINGNQLSRGQTYSFTITQQGNCGAGAALSATSQVTLPASVSAPTIKAYGSCTGISIQLQQSTQFSNYNNLVLQQSSTGNSNDFRDVQNIVLGGSSFNVNGLQTGVQYYFRLKQKTQCDTVYSNIDNARISVATQPTIQASPSCNQVQLNWSVGSDVSSFIIEASTAFNSGWTQVYNSQQSNIQSLQTSTSVSRIGTNNLSSGSSYQFRITTSGQCSPQTASTTATLPTTIPPVLVVLGTCSSYKLSWQGGSGTGAYSLQYSTVSGANANWQTINGFTTQNSLNSIDLNSNNLGVNFVAGQQYYFRLYQKGQCGEVQSNEQRIVWSCTTSAPTNLKIDSVSGSQVCISWSYFQGSNSPVTGYDVQVQTSYGSWLSIAANSCMSNSNNCCFQYQQQAGNQWFNANQCFDVAVRIASKCECSQSAWSNSAQHRTKTVPQAPSSLYSSCQGSSSFNQITINWSAPAFDGCDSITHYKVFYIAIPCVNYWTNVLTTYNQNYQWISINQNIPANQQSFTLQSGVTEGERYAFVVQACNSQGCSSYSQSIQTVALPAPSVPLGLQVKDIGGDMIELSWTRPTQNFNTIIGYSVSVNGQPSSNARCFFQDATATQCIMMLDHLRSLNIAVGNTFSLSISANSHTCKSASSNSVSYQMTADKCGPINFIAKPLIDEQERVETVEIDDEENDPQVEYDETVNLAAQVSTSTIQTQTEEESNPVVIFVLGVVCTLGLQVLVVGAYFMYTRYSKKEKLPDGAALPPIEDEQVSVDHNRSTKGLVISPKQVVAEERIEENEEIKA